MKHTKNPSANKFNQLIKLIENSISKKNYPQAIKHLLSAKKIEPNNFAIVNEIGTCYSKIGDHHKALLFHSEANDLNANNAIILCNIGLDLLKLQKFNDSIIFLNQSISINPTNYMPYNGLASAYHNLGDYLNLSQVCIKAITLFPDNADFHGNLGTALIGLDQLESAKYATETALILNPTSIDAKLNLARILSLENSTSKSIEVYEELLKSAEVTRPDLIPLIKYNLSFEYLNQGSLIQGWSFYEFGFNKEISISQSRRPNRRFKVTHWNGEDLDGKRLLIWGEQGVGDEILFMSMLSDVGCKEENIIIECDSRLVTIVKRSFPSFDVRPSAFNIDGSAVFEDYDFHIPIGSLAKIFRKSHQDFVKSKPYLIPNNLNNCDFISFIKASSQPLKIGLCWRSGFLNSERNKNYIPLSKWASIFDIPNALFINLQYGECEDEIINAEKIFKVDIHRSNQIDLRNDFEKTFCIINELDYIVTAGTAVSAMAFSIGKPSLTFLPRLGWDSLGTDYYPWSKNMIPFTPKDNNSLESTLSDIAKYILQQPNLRDK